MARQIGRNWNKDRIRIWNKDTENNSLPPPPLPPRLPPPLLPSPPSVPFQSETHEIHHSKLEESGFAICQDEPCYDARMRNGDRNLSKGFSFPESQRRMPSTQRLYETRDVDIARQGLGPSQQVHVVLPLQEKLKGDKLKRFTTRVRDEAHRGLSPPPPPPRFDFPIETRTPTREYRRVDEYDEDPRLRAELYPLEEELLRKEVQGSYRQAPETIEILPERYIKEQDKSELNLVPTQRIKEDRRVEAYPERTETRAGTSVRNPNTNAHEFGYSAGRRSKEALNKDPTRSDSETIEERHVKKAQAMPDRLEQNRGQPDRVGYGRNLHHRDEERDSIWNALEKEAYGETEQRNLKQPAHRTEDARGYGPSVSERRNSQRRYERRNDLERGTPADDTRAFTERPVNRSLPIEDHTERIIDRRAGRIDNPVESVAGRRGVPEDDIRVREISGRSTAVDNPRERIMDKMTTPVIDHREAVVDRMSIPVEDLKDSLADRRNMPADDFREKFVDGRGNMDDQRGRYMDRRNSLTDDLRESAMGRNPATDVDKELSTERRTIVTNDFRERHINRTNLLSDNLRDGSVDRNRRPDENVHDFRNPLLERRTAADSLWERGRYSIDDPSDFRGIRHRSERIAGHADGRNQRWSAPIENVVDPQELRLDRQHMQMGDISRIRHLEPKGPEGFHDAEKERRKSDLYIHSGTDLHRRRSGGDTTKMVVNGPRSSPQYEILKEEPEDIPVEKRDSVMLPDLEESEKEFHELVAAGDVAAVRIFLSDHPGFNINCVNYQKISALHVAVHEQNEAMVDFLLEQISLDCSDCALYAIKEGNIRIVEKIMDKLRQTSPGLEYAATTHSVDFPDDMTPIILAAQLGNYEIIDFLIKRDHIIPPVHNPYCKCEACRADLQKYDRLKYSTMKLNLYKAISNPMYIFHVTDDPFQRAFDLTQELLDAAKVFPQFKSSYEELWRDLRNFTVELIGCCRNAQEVEIILKKSANNLAGSITFPRLQYAIDLKQKEFVSHPYTQAVLVDAWTGDLLEWKVRSPLMQALAVFPRIPMLPVMAVMCMFLPNHKLVKKWKTPVNKMISSVASYLIFLIILFLESNLDKRNQKRGPPNSGLESLIIIYVIGYIWLNIRLCFRLGPKRFFSALWHWYDCIMLFLFTMTITFWVASLADITANNEIDLPRKYWNSLDPELIAEGFFAAAVIMAYFRLNMFLSLNYHLGPLQVSIGKMTVDIFRFIIIFFIIIIAWCAGLCRFYQPYDGMVQKDAVSGSSTTQVSSFVSFSMTLKTFFWAIFGMSPIESADVVIENLPGDTPDTTIINHHEFTEAVGYIAFALFQFLSVVVVLNMLVACMANTFTKVIDNVTVEWVFGRSQIYLSFMAASTLPPPFNLLPTASGIKSTFFWLKLLAKPSNGQRAKCNISHCCYIESETEAYVNTEFPSLMSELAQRYLRLKGESVETHDDLEELKCEMKELLRKMDKIITIRKNS